MWSSLLVVVLVLCAVCSCDGAGAEKTPPHPHIIMVVLRDMGFDDVSLHGNPEIPTPNIDRIANHGVILQQYYTTPYCEDSVTAYRTGKYPIHYRKPRYGDQQPVTYDLWNYLDIQSYVIREVGTIDCEDTNIPFYPWDVVQKSEFVLREHDQNYPLFLQINFPQLHADYPAQVPTEYLDKVKSIPSEGRRIYAGMIMELDRAVGHLIRIMYDTGILHNGILAFTTLTGGTKGNNFYTWPSNYPFRGGNGTVWEGGSRALSFVYSNRIAKRGRASYGLMHITDWLPTLFRLAGGNPEHVVNGDGMDLWDTINAEGYSPRMEVLYGIYGKRSAVRVGDFKLIIGEDSVPLSSRPTAKAEMDNLMRPMTVWDSELECTVYPDAIGCWPDISPCLFNVRFDPCEVNNVAYYMPQTVEALRYSLERYNDTALYREDRDKRQSADVRGAAKKLSKGLIETQRKLAWSKSRMVREEVVIK